MINGEDIRNFLDATIGDMAVNHSFYGISYKEFIDPDTKINPDVKAKLVIEKGLMTTSRIWQYRIVFVRDSIPFAVYAIAQLITDEEMTANKKTVKHIREFFREDTVNQIWNIALQQLVIYSMNQHYVIAKQEHDQQQAMITNVAPV